MAKDTDVDGLVDADREPVALGDAAAAALDNIGDEHGAQDALDGTDFTKVKFVGMSFDAVEDRTIAIGDEMTFLVRARCVGKGDEASKRDGTIRHYAKMDVQSVVVHE